MLNENFTHLHCHSEYSLLDGCGMLEKFVDRALDMGFKYLGLTDHGNVDGVIQFQKIGKNKGIIPIIGAELYIVPNALSKKKGEKRGHIVAFVRNKKGWQNLLKMLTYANIECLDDLARKKYIMKLTQDFSIYSFGWYGIWKPIRSEDMISDLERLKYLINNETIRRGL